MRSPWGHHLQSHQGLLPCWSLFSSLWASAVTLSWGSSGNGVSLAVVVLLALKQALKELRASVSKGSLCNFLAVVSNTLNALPHATRIVWGKMSSYFCSTVQLCPLYARHQASLRCPECICIPRFRCSVLHPQRRGTSALKQGFWFEGIVIVLLIVTYSRILEFFFISYNVYNEKEINMGRYEIVRHSDVGK